MSLSFNKFILFILFIAQVLAQHHTPIRFSLKSTANDSNFISGLSSNIVAEIRLLGDSLTWLGTGQGLAFHDGHKVYSHKTTSDSLGDNTVTNLIPVGGIPSVSVDGEKIAVSFSGDNGSIQVGYGITYADLSNYNDSSLINWTYLQQPRDYSGEDTIVQFFGEGSFNMLPVTVKEANVTYDSQLLNDTLYTASWAGGLRRYHINAGFWENVPMPMDSQDSLSTCEGFVDDGLGRLIKPGYYLNPRDPSDGGNHNHKAFSVLLVPSSDIAISDTIWVGTANGINRGEIIRTREPSTVPDAPDEITRCIEWVHYRFPEDGLSGNFVVGLAKQTWNNKTTIWAATMNADSQGETRGLSYSRDGGETWKSTLLGERIYNVFAKDSLVLASSQSGLWKSFDGVNWAIFEPAIDRTFLSQSQILTDIVYTSVLDQRDTTQLLWIGTSDGLAYSTDLKGENWTIFQTEYDADQFYAYPNPFSPQNHNQLGSEGYVRFHTGSIANREVKLEIFNFAMEKVYDKVFSLDSYNGALKWDGRDLNGKHVSNGVYFIKMNYSQSANKSPQDYWNKLIVVK